MRRAYLALVVVTAGAGALAFTAPGAHPGVAPEPAGVAQDAGKAIFEGKGNCFTCHRQDGKGTPLAPDLTDDAWVNFDGRPTAEAVAALVRKGVAQPKQHPAPMPPMGGGSLSDDEIDAVAAYVLSLSAGPE